MPFSEYSSKQKKLARIAEPRDAITEADFKALRKKDGGMIKYQDGGDVDSGDTRTAELEEMLRTAEEAGNFDLVEELKSDLFKETGRSYRYGGKVKGYSSGMSVSSDTDRGCGAAVSGKKFSGTF